MCIVPQYNSTQFFLSVDMNVWLVKQHSYFVCRAHKTQLISFKNHRTDPHGWIMLCKLPMTMDRYWKAWHRPYLEESKIQDSDSGFRNKNEANFNSRLNLKLITRVHKKEWWDDRRMDFTINDLNLNIQEVSSILLSKAVVKAAFTVGSCVVSFKIRLTMFWGFFFL